MTATADTAEDKRLARLYDYTKFHIGIYLSFAGGLAALLGTENAGLVLSSLVEPNKCKLYLALGLMILAGMCGGVVASSAIEHEKFDDFWSKDQGPQIVPFLAFAGKRWAAAEHAFFWLSLLVLAYTVAFGFASVKVLAEGKPEQASQATYCCAQVASAVGCATK